MITVLTMEEKILLTVLTVKQLFVKNYIVYDQGQPSNFSDTAIYIQTLFFVHTYI